MQKLNAIRTVALICIAGKAVSISFAGAEDGLPLSVTINSLLINFLLLALLYFSVEFALRFFIWPQTRNIYAIAAFRKNKKKAVAKAEAQKFLSIETFTFFSPYITAGNATKTLSR